MRKNQARSSWSWRLREDTQKLKGEKATLEGMVESRDELIMEIAKEIGLDRMGENAKDEDEEDGDANDGGDAAARPGPPTATPEEVVEEEDHVEMVPKQEAPMAHEVILAYAKLENPQTYLYHALMREYEESPPRMMDCLDDLDDDLNEGPCRNYTLINYFLQTNK
jgi:hypothetical protein